MAGGWGHAGQQAAEDLCRLDHGQPQPSAQAEGLPQTSPACPAQSCSQVRIQLGARDWRRAIQGLLPEIGHQESKRAKICGGLLPPMSNQNIKSFTLRADHSLDCSMIHVSSLMRLSAGPFRSTAQECCTELTGQPSSPGLPERLVLDRQECAAALQGHKEVHARGAVHHC